MCCFLLYVSSSDVTQAQLCPSGYHTYNTGSCLTVENTTRQQFSQARTTCQSTNNGDLITVSSSGELFVLRGYVRALGEQGAVFWVGYQYNGSILQSVVDGSSAPNIVTSNIASNGVSGTNGICLGLRQDGMFVNTDCTTTLGYVCVYTITSMYPVIHFVLHECPFYYLFIHSSVYISITSTYTSICPFIYPFIHYQIQMSLLFK